MGLSVPREPIELKKLIRVIRAGMGGSNDIDYDSQAVWSFNRLPKYLWREWGRELRDRGITWQKFLRILKLHTIDMIEWALRDTISWRELVERIGKSIDSYSKS